MSHYETVWTFETANIRVALEVTPDDDLDLSWDGDGEIREGLENGRFVAFVARVQCTHKDTGAVLGSDYLGGCIYESAQAFRDERKGYFSDMVRGSLYEARKQLRQLQAIYVREA